MKDITLVDLNDNPIAGCEKMEAHEKALLHRAFSVFIYHDGKMLIQKRAAHKYHCPSLWTNACCSHPSWGENLNDAVSRRLKEELELSIETKEIFSFPYFYAFDNGLCEYEYDHVFVSCYEGEVQLNPEEVEAVEWIEFDELLEDIRMNPKKYTPWFIIACPQVIAWLKKNN